MQISSSRNHHIISHKCKKLKGFQDKIIYYLSYDSNLCEGVPEYYHDVKSIKENSVSFDHQHENIYDTNCQLYFTKDRKCKGRKCLKCSLLTRRIKSKLSTTNNRKTVNDSDKQNNNKNDTVKETSKKQYSYMNTDELIETIHNLNAKNKQLTKERDKAVAANEKLRKLLHLDEREDDNEFHDLIDLLLDNFSEYNQMFKINPMRAEVDYDQFRNRLMRHRGSENNNIWRRGSILFFGQMNIRGGLYEDVRDLDFMEMPCKKTINLRQFMSRIPDGMKHQHIQCCETFYHQFCDKKKIAQKNRNAFIFQVLQ